MSLGHDHEGHHICMWEGPSPYPSALEVNHEILKTENESHIAEIQRLRALLVKNKVEWTPPPTKPRTKKWTLRQSSIKGWVMSNQPDKALPNLPHLPNEILIRILGHTVTNKSAIIDPFWKLRRENITKHEKENAAVNIGFLGTCKAFHIEGTRLFFANNTFVFTQVAALENLSRFHVELRNPINHVTIRVVGRYFDDTAYRKVIGGLSTYHEDVINPTVFVAARPAGTIKDKGIEAYCWQQLFDFLQALSVTNSTYVSITPLLPSLQTMRLDLVNFCEHLPFVGSSFLAVIRWKLGKLLDELIVTGAMNDDGMMGDHHYLPVMLKDEGVYAHGPPIFLSMKTQLRRLRGDELHLQLIRPNPGPPAKAESKHVQLLHPEGGAPPKSKFPDDATVWKYIKDRSDSPKRKWVEFHRRCGLEVSECGELEPLTDSEGEYEDMSDDSDDNDRDVD